MTHSPNVFCPSAGASRGRSLALTVCLAACVVVVTTARAGDLYTQNFNSYSSANPTTSQVTTGLTVAFGGTITGWNRAGDDAIHAVRLATGDWAPMFYDGGSNNIITTASTIAGANTTNATYRVTFQVAPGVYANSAQATTAADAVILSLLTSDSSTTLSSGTFFPGAFVGQATSGNLPFQTAAFDYQGTGSDSGVLNLRFAANNPGAQRFGGTVDNVILQTTARWNNGTSGNWSTGANWLSGAAPVNTDLVLIDGTAGGASANDLSSLSAAGIEFVSGAGSFTVSGSAITLSGSNIYNGVTNASTSAQTLALNLVLGGTTRTFNSVGRLTVSGDISDGANSAGLTKTGAGTVVLTASNSYTGGTRVNAGTLSFVTNALGSGMVTVSGGTLQWAAGNTQDVSPRLAFVNATTATFDTNGNNAQFGSSIGGATTASVVKAGNGTLTLSASNTYGGDTTISAGVLALSGSGKIYGGAGNSTAVVTVNSGAVLEFDKWDSGFADWGKGSFGQLLFDAARMVVNGGTLRNTLSNSSLAPAANDGRAFTIGALGATLESTAGQTWYVNADSRYGSLASNGGQLTLGGAGNGDMKNIIPGTGGVTMAGSGTWTLSAANTYSGNTSISAGTLQIGGAGVLGNGSYAGAIANAGTLDVATSQNQTLSGAISGVGELAKSGASVLTLSASNSYSGGTRIMAGTVEFANGGLGASGTITMNGGSLRWANGNQQDLSSRLTLVNATFATFDTNGNNVTFGSGIGGATTASFVKAGNGTLTLSASNTYGGDTTISAGVLALSGSGKIYGGAGNSTAVVTVNSGAVLEFDKWDSGFADWGKGSFGQLLFDAARMVVNGGTLRNTLSNSSLAPAANDGRAFTIGALGATLESTAGQTWYVNADSRYGSLASNGGQLTLGGAGNGDMKNIIPGTGGVTMAGSGTWTLSAANTYSGNTTINAGRLLVAATGQINSTSGITLDGMGAELKYNSATALTRPISFTGSGGTLSGTGVIGSPLALGTNAILSPGNSPGILTGTAGVAWNPGGTYAWELNALSGTTGTNWDLLAVTAGGLDLSSLSTSNRFTLDLITLTGSNSAGPLDIGYVAGSTYEFLIASYNSLSVPGSFSTAANADLTGLFTISLENWQGTQPSLSDMSVKVNSAGTGLALVIVPEPGAVALAGIGVVIAGLVALRSRRGAS